MTPQNKLYEAAKNVWKVADKINAKANGLSVLVPDEDFCALMRSIHELSTASSAYEQEQPEAIASCSTCKWNQAKFDYKCDDCINFSLWEHDNEDVQQPEAIAGEKTAEEILDQVYDTEYRSNYKTDYSKQCILKVMQLYASQQTSAKDKEIKELKQRISVIKEKLPDNKIRELNPIWVRDEIISELEKLI